jgi:hypothetical protein
MASTIAERGEPDYYAKCPRVVRQAIPDIWEVDSLEALREIPKADFRQSITNTLILMTSVCRVWKGKSRNKVKIKTLEERIPSFELTCFFPVLSFYKMFAMYLSLKTDKNSEGRKIHEKNQS